MTQRRTAIGKHANVVSFPLHAQEREEAAFNLVDRLSEVFERADEDVFQTQAYAHELDRRLQETSRALEHTQAQMRASEGRLLILEERAECAEEEAREAKRALALVEEALLKLLQGLKPLTH